jgi:hypothetical protein
VASSLLENFLAPIASCLAILLLSVVLAVATGFAAEAVVGDEKAELCLESPDDGVAAGEDGDKVEPLGLEAGVDEKVDPLLGLDAGVDEKVDPLDFDGDDEKLDDREDENDELRELLLLKLPLASTAPASNIKTLHSARTRNFFILRLLFGFEILLYKTYTSYYTNSYNNLLILKSYM